MPWCATWWTESVPQRPPGRVGGVAVGPDEVEDPLDEAPQAADAAGEDRHDDLDDADLREAQVEAVHAEPAQEDPEQAGRDLGLRLRVVGDHAVRGGLAIARLAVAGRLVPGWRLLVPGWRRLLLPVRRRLLRLLPGRWRQRCGRVAGRVVGCRRLRRGLGHLVPPLTP